MFLNITYNIIDVKKVKEILQFQAIYQSLLLINLVGNTYWIAIIKCTCIY